MPASLLAKYGETIPYTDFDDDAIQQDYRSELGQMLSSHFDDILMKELNSYNPIYIAHQAGIHLPHPWDSSHYRQANLGHLAKHYPEFLI